MRNESFQDEEEGLDYGVLYRDELPNLPDLQFGNIINDAKVRVGGWRKVATYVGYLSERNKTQAAIQCPQLSSFINLDVNFSFKGSIFHQLMIRMLKHKKNKTNYEYWFLVNGKPLRFSIFEFALITGLRFTKEVVDSEADKLQKSTLKEDCFPNAGSRLITVKEVEEKLKSLKEQEKETEARLKLFFVLIIVNVILHDRSMLIQDEIFQVCDFLEICNNYDWGKRCWSKTFSAIEDRVNVSNDNKLHQWRTEGCPWFILYWMLEAIQGMDVKFEGERVPGTEMIYPRMLRWKLGSRGLDNQESRDFLNMVNVVFLQLKADSTEKDLFYMKNLEQLMSKYNSRNDSYKVLRDLKCVSIQERLPNYVLNAPVGKKASRHPSTSNIDDTRMHNIEERQVQLMQIQLKIMEKIEEDRKLAEEDRKLAEQRHAQMMERLAALEQRKVVAQEEVGAKPSSVPAKPPHKKLKA